MSKSKKLGYTFYPRDWNSDDQVFELNLEQRGVFRELIDSAYMTDNVIPFNVNTWARRWNVAVDHLESILDRLVELELITIDDQFVHVPSCELRLNIIRRNQQNGQGGGRPSKPKQNPNGNPNETQTERQRKEKGKEKKGKENNLPFEQIIDHLNQTCGTKYKHTSSATQTKITARINEGFTVDDFKTVINHKFKDWGRDEKMKSFLRPETLFGTKFESYLNDAPKATTNGSAPQQYPWTAYDIERMFGEPRNPEFKSRDQEGADRIVEYSFTKPPQS